MVIYLQKPPFTVHTIIRLAKFGWNWPSGSMKKIFKRFPISLLSQLRKSLDPLFEQTWIPFTLGCFMSSLVKIGPVVHVRKRQHYNSAK